MIKCAAVSNKKNHCSRFCIFTNFRWLRRRKTVVNENIADEFNVT